MDTTNSLPITVYTTPDCQMCRLTKKWLQDHGVQYRVVDLSEDAIALQKVKQMGYQSAPVVVVPFDWPHAGEHWYGFRPDLLQGLIG